jgi:hypothetical protein
VLAESPLAAGPASARLDVPGVAAEDADAEDPEAEGVEAGDAGLGDAGVLEPPLPPPPPVMDPFAEADSLAFCGWELPVRAEPERPSFAGATLPGGTTSLGLTGTGRSLNERMLTGSPTGTGKGPAGTFAGGGGEGGLGSTSLASVWVGTGSGCAKSRSGGSISGGAAG